MKMILKDKPPSHPIKSFKMKKVELTLHKVQDFCHQNKSQNYRNSLYKLLVLAINNC